MNSLPDYSTLIQAGIDPKTRLPIRVGKEEKCTLKEEIKRTLRIVDEQDAVNRYIWYNLPDSLDGQLLERILYYKGQAMFFYIETLNQFFFLPYALDGTIDVYGRFLGVTPVPFGGGKTETEGVWVQGLVRKPVYNYIDVDMDVYKDGCVLLNDYTKQIGETIIPRAILQEPILDCMSEAFPLARTNLICNSGVKGMRVNDEDQQAQVKRASKSITDAALTGNPWIPIVGNLEFQDLTNGGTVKAGDYLQYMQSLDNQRLSLYGLRNGGVFDKDNTYINNDQVANIQQNVGLVYQDGLTLRQKFCNLVNHIWGLGIWCEASETVVNSDKDMNGEVADDIEPEEQDNMNKEAPVNDM